MKRGIILYSILFLSIVAKAQQHPVKLLNRSAITGIAHASFYTKDIQANTAFYSNYLGFTDTLQPNKNASNICQQCHYATY